MSLPEPVDPEQQPAQTPQPAPGRHSAPQQPPVGYPAQQFTPGHQPPASYPAQQYPGQPYPSQQYPGQPYPSQQYPNPQYPGQPNLAQQYQNPPYPAQPYPAQHYPNPPYPAQQYPAQPHPAQPYPVQQYPPAPSPRPPYPPSAGAQQGFGQQGYPQQGYPQQGPRPDYPEQPPRDPSAWQDPPAHAAVAAEPDRVPGQASRRALIAGAGVAVVAGAAGFGWYSLAGPKPRATAPAGEYTSPGGAGATQTSLATVAEIPEGGGIVLADQEVVLTRESGDKVHCFTAVCTHQGCLVSQVTAGKITCPCHGSAFDAATGAVVNGPATTPLKAIAVTIVNGTIYSG